MSKKLYVGNMSYGTTEDQIRDLFAQVGEVSSVAIITDRETGRAKGFGFVEMNNDEQGQEAIKRFNGYTLDNRTLTVNEARPREERSGGSFGGDYGGGRRENRSFGSRSNSGYSGNRNRF
jgi:cold-inducible RNA-binding protein